MGMVALPSPLLLTSYPSTVTSGVIDAVGESFSSIGRVRLQGGAGASAKTFSSSGGSIYWPTGTNVFSNGSTTVRVGIQDPSVTTGLEDTGWDVYADLTGGGGGITNSSWNNTAMTNGSRSIAHGDIVAVVVEMTARGGADAISLRRHSANSYIGAATALFPYGTADTGTLAKSINPLVCMLKFDDGTVGWIDFNVPCNHPLATITTQAFNSGSSPDEYIATFTVPFACGLDIVGWLAANMAAADTYEFVLYSDPYGTPSVIETITPDTDVQFNSVSVGWLTTQITPRTLVPGTVYGLALRATSANNIEINYSNLGSGFDILKRALPISDLKLAARTDQTGAFSVVQDYHVPIVLLGITKLDDGLSPVGRALIVQAATQY